MQTGVYAERVQQGLNTQKPMSCTTLAGYNWKICSKKFFQIHFSDITATKVVYLFLELSCHTGRYSMLYKQTHRQTDRKTCTAAFSKHWCSVNVDRTTSSYLHLYYTGNISLMSSLWFQFQTLSKDNLKWIHWTGPSPVNIHCVSYRLMTGYPPPHAFCSSAAHHESNTQPIHRGAIIGNI